MGQTGGEASTGQCTPADEAKMNEFGSGNHDGSFPAVLADCGRKAVSFWGAWRGDKMDQCIREKVEISPPCTQCFTQAGQFGYNNCKFQCLFGTWCSDRCLGCTAQHDAETEACVGVAVPQPEVC